MSKQEQLLQTIQQGYTFKGASIDLGAAMLDGETVPGALVKLPLKTMNRHGLIAGATGGGKTKTLQILAEHFSENGIPSLLMDIKGDLSGIAMPGASNAKIEERHAKIAIPFTPAGNSVEFLTLSNEKGARLRATVTEFGPVLFSRILGLNDTQSSIMSVVFKYCDDNQLPLLDLQDIRSVLQYLTNEGKADIEKLYGRISTDSVGTIMRKIVELEQQRADLFFGERSFAVEDLIRLDSQGRGMISIVRLTDIQDRPKLFSTFMLQMLAEIYSTFPEAGDLDKPKLAIFIDEAHLVFDEASSALLDQIEAIIRLIRSKGIGIFFVTQNPADIPDAVLGQLGLKIQHALRAFTAKDRKAIKLAAENYPISDFYNVEDIITQLGIGEALVTVLNEKGIPTPLAHVMLRAPQSRMDVLTDMEIDNIISRSSLVRKYNEVINRESAHEVLTEKMQEAAEEEQQQERKNQRRQAEEVVPRNRRREKSTFEEIIDSPTTRQIGNTIARELTRGLLGVLGIGGTSRRRKSKTGWF
ncbi:MAG: helicase HerA-like domain-containing protein [Saprospiraceae bacterium]